MSSRLLKLIELSVNLFSSTFLLFLLNIKFNGVSHPVKAAVQPLRLQ